MKKLTKKQETLAKWIVDRLAQPSPTGAAQHAEVCFNLDAAACRVVGVRQGG